jgi:hypothetical protein
MVLKLLKHRKKIELSFETPDLLTSLKKLGLATLSPYRLV